MRKYGMKDGEPYFRSSVFPYFFIHEQNIKMANGAIYFSPKSPSIPTVYLVYYYCHRLIDLLLLTADQKQTPSLGAILEAVLFM